MDYLSVCLAPEAIGRISSLGLAHLGDAVYELLVRTWLCMEGRSTSKGLHRATVSHVKAPAQAAAARRILSELTPEEHAVFRRGRNAKVNSVPKNAALEDYHLATGLEALYGDLYLRGQKERINELFALGLDRPAAAGTCGSRPSGGGSDEDAI